MTITVIKPGVLPETHPMLGKCYNCFCEIECAKGDTEPQNDGRNGTNYKVRCPTCAQPMWVEAVK